MKSITRELRRFKRRYGPRGGASDRRPRVVREDAGYAKRLIAAMARAEAGR